MSKNIELIDKKIEDIYSVVYAKNEEPEIVPININNLKLERFKLNDYNMDDIFDNGKIQFVRKNPIGINKNGSSLEEIIFKRHGSKHFCFIRIIAYDNEKSIYEINDPVTVCQVIRTILSTLVIEDRLKGLLLPVRNIDVKGDDLTGYDELKKYIDPNRFYSVQVTERFYSMTTLNNFLKDYPMDLTVMKTIIQQVINIIHQITSMYPSFRHNNLLLSSMDCYIKKINGIIIPEIKLGNFYSSVITGVIENKYHIFSTPQLPPYTDVYTFLNNLWLDYGTEISKYPEAVKFFDTYLPKKIRSSTEMHITENRFNDLSVDEINKLKLRNILDDPFLRQETIKKEEYSDVPSINSELTGGTSERGTFHGTSERSTFHGTLEQGTPHETSDRNSTEDMDSEMSMSLIPIVRVSDQKLTEDKKSSDSDIDMSSKSRQRKQKKHADDEYDDSDFSVGSRIERDDRQPSSRVYKGTRQIGDNSREQQLRELTAELNPKQQSYHSNGSMVNSIGNALGATPNDLSRVATYNQMMQQSMEQQLPQSLNQMSYPQDDYMMNYMRAAAGPYEMNQQQYPYQYQQMPMTTSMPAMPQPMMQQPQMVMPMQPGQMTGGGRQPFFFR